MTLSMRERQAITKEMARRYAKASKKQRGAMLDELCALAGYNRSYTARLLREKVRGAPPRKRRRGRRAVYGPELIAQSAPCWPRQAKRKGRAAGRRPALSSCCRGPRRPVSDERETQ